MIITVCNEGELIGLIRIKSATGIEIYLSRADGAVRLDAEFKEGESILVGKVIVFKNEVRIGRGYKSCVDLAVRYGVCNVVSLSASLREVDVLGVLYLRAVKKILTLVSRLVEIVTQSEEVGGGRGLGGGGVVGVTAVHSNENVHGVF